MQRAVNKSTFRYNSTLIVRLVILPVFDCNGCCNDEYAVVGAVASAFWAGEDDTLFEVFDCAWLICYRTYCQS